MKWTEPLNIAREAALRAGAMLRDSMACDRRIDFKGEINLVTDFDRESQRIIHEHIRDHYPDHDFLAEENLEENRGSGFRWIIDPIDGTTNFAHRFPVFCIAIALQARGQVVAAVVYDPTRDEMFEAVLGGGACLNSRPISVSPIDDLDRSLLSTGFPYDIRDSRENNLDHFCDFAVRSQAVRRCGSAALDLSYLACGRFDGFWELKLYPWDVAAGGLLVKEAGGRLSDFRGGEFDIFGDSILASNGRIHDQMIDVLRLRRMGDGRDGDEVTS